MTTENLQYYVQRRVRRKEQREHYKDTSGRFYEKTLSIVEVCRHCRKEFAYSSRRRLCPICLGVLLEKITVTKPPPLSPEPDSFSFNQLSKRPNLLDSK